MRILGLLLWVGCIICWVIVLIKMFQTEGALKGILGLICGLYALIWGWMNGARLGIKNIVMIWTLLVVLAIIVNVMTGGFSYSIGTPAP